MKLDKPIKIFTKNFYDKRGYFKEVYQLKKQKKKFIFDCFSKSKKNVFRGLHFQFKKSQAKLITVTKGKIIDYAVDIRKKSPNFGKVFKFTVNENSNFSVYIPKGFAHGYLCLSESCTIYYKCSDYRQKKNEVSINYKLLKINKKKLIISPKDKNAKSFEQLQKEKVI